MNQCPFCSIEDPYEILNIGPAYWGCCERHMSRWYLGDRFLDGWRDQPEVYAEMSLERLDRCDLVQEIAVPEMEPVKQERAASSLPTGGVEPPRLETPVANQERTE